MLYYNYNKGELYAIDKSSKWKDKSIEVYKKTWLYRYV